MSISQPTLEQQRAAHALRHIECLVPKPDDRTHGRLASDFKSYVESFPATIVMNGLGQACATLLAQAKGKSGDDDAHRRLYDHLQNWLFDDAAGVRLKKPGVTTLMEAIVQSDQVTYCHAQAEALAYLVWLKKFAQAFLSKFEKGGCDGQ